MTATDDEIARIMVRASAGHVFADMHRCVCGFAPDTGYDWKLHHARVQLAAARPLIEAGSG